MTSDVKTHVYITPTLAVDLKLLGQAAEAFQGAFDYLGVPAQRYWELDGEDWLEDVGTFTKNGPKGREVDFPGGL